MKAFFDLKDAKGGTVFVFDGKKGQFSSMPFTIDAEGKKLSIEEQLPAVEDVRLALPLFMLGFRLLEFPFPGMEKIRHALPFELEGMVLKGLDEIVWDVIPVGHAEGTQRVLAVYTEKKALRGILNSFKQVSLEPSVVTSIELTHVLDAQVLNDNETGADISEALLSPPPSGLEERAALAQAELARQKPTINLRAGELQYTKPREEFGRRMKTAFVLVSLLLLIFSIKSAMGLYFLNKEAGAMERQMKRSLSNMMPGRGEGNMEVSLMELEGGLTELRREQAGFGGVSPLEALKKLSLHKAGGVVISGISMNAQGMTLKGEARTLSDVEAEKNAISQDFDQVNVLETNQSGNTVLFTLRIK
ncbi:MAG: hypothetical protein M0Z61_06705 [Nitrospiraceae bacterium]|nr:hypothetical protein [Nitrospiraceae bacterium]